MVVGKWGWVAIDDSGRTTVQGNGWVMMGVMGWVWLAIKSYNLQHTLGNNNTYAMESINVCIM
jgi:hypothetical protein